MRAPLARLVPAYALALVVALATGAAGAPAAAPAPAAVAIAVGPIGMTVSDLDRSIAFYTGVLGFMEESRVEVQGDAFEHLTGVFGARARVARLRLGDERIELTEYVAPRGRPVPVDFRSNDRWFQHVAIITSDMAKAYARLRERGVVHASTGPQRLPDWNPNAGGIEAFYFRDPDGHHLDILAFPEGKGAAKWHRTPASSEERLFLGIDHTAIVVSDTEASLAFYRDALGLRVAGTSENWGVEQEHLNNVFGARLRITALRAAEGPGIEFLEYLAPRDGRPAPLDTRSNDLFHWQTTIVTRDVERAFTALRGVHAAFVSPGAVALPDTHLGFTKALLTRDPDGHALEVIER